MSTANFFKTALKRGTSSSGSNTTNELILKTTAFASIASVIGAYSTLEQQRHTKINVAKPFNAKEGYLSISRITNPFNQKFLAPNLTLCDASAQPEEVDQRDESTNNDVGGEDPTTYYLKKMAEFPPDFVKSHAIYGGLRKPGFIERYDCYRRVPLSENDKDGSVSTIDQEVCMASIKIGDELNGHDKVVHGGIISLMIDDTFGRGYEAMGLAQGKEFGDEDFPLVVTANLTVNYRAPLPAGSDVVIRVRHENTSGRKIYMSAKMESHDGSIVYSEATALFVTVAKQHLSSTIIPQRMMTLKPTKKME
jgi:acyl-coenzyme A thioesterase PaaI-like protein|eukprot:scaffold2858_cov256-Chaetoceros_neogracile.AAC.1